MKHNNPSLDTFAVAELMRVIETLIPDCSPEAVAALTFSLVEKAIGAGLSIDEAQENLARAFAAHGTARKAVQQ